MKAKCNYHQPPPWFRLYNELADDPKIRRVAVLSGQHELIITGLWVKLLIIANKSPVRGELRMAINVPYSIEDVSYDSRLTLDEAKSLLEAFIRVNMLHKEGDCYIITHFNDRQYKSDTDGAERTRRYRQRRMGDKQDEQVDKIDDYTKRHSDVTQPECDVTVTLPESESESESESDDNDNRGDKKASEIFSLYQNNITIDISQVTRDEMLSPDYFELPLEWWQASIKIASDNNKRNWSYIRKILDNWKLSGHMTNNNQNGDKPNGSKPAYSLTPAELEAIQRLNQLE